MYGHSESTLSCGTTPLASFPWISASHYVVVSRASRIFRPEKYGWLMVNAVMLA